MLRRWKGGVSEYSSVIVVRKDSGITDLDGLRGHNIACEDPESTSGYILPKASLISLGYKLVEMSGPTIAVPNDQIGYVFSGGEENLLPWVLSGKTTASFMAIALFNEQPQTDKDQLTVLYQTISVPRHIMLVNPTMDKTLRDKIVQLMMEMDQNPEGKQVLTTFEKTAKFDNFPKDPVDTIKDLIDLFEHVQ